MIKVLSTNITSPLGLTTEENYLSLKEGKTALSVYNDWRGIPYSFTASLFSSEQEECLLMEGFTRYESIVIHSIKEALSHTNIDIHSEKTALILSTTKANVEELSASEDSDGNYAKPGTSAKKISNFLGLTTEPIVVCNACISGVTAQVLADRLINNGTYNNIIVCGADSQSPFVVSGFMSFKSLSPFECKPFDIERLGLNLGEAAATIIFEKLSSTEENDNSWKLITGALNNDAYHVSAPSPNGDGVCNVTKVILETIESESLAVVSLHGTATMFNDQMESKAIESSNLSDIPISAVKGYYGHTLGAAGVLETIVTMKSIDENIILPVRGYSEIGVSGKINVSNEIQYTNKDTFIKLISGFGGCNGAVAFSKSSNYVQSKYKKKTLNTLGSVKITPNSLLIDGEQKEVSNTGKSLLTEIYKSYVNTYPKFHKMDILSKLAFLAAELVYKKQTNKHYEHEQAVILFNSSSSVVSDRKHIETFNNKNGFYPSPSVFLYTLPNIVTGEIAIRHKFKGETTLYILNEYNEHIINTIVESTFAQSSVKSMITGWVDCSSDDVFEADIKLVTI